MIEEQFARLTLQVECADVVHKAKETAGAMIQQAALERGDDLVGLFNDCKAVISAYILQLAAYQNQ